MNRSDIQDISYNKLYEIEDLYKAVFETSGNISVILDNEGYVLIANDNLLSITGLNYISEERIHLSSFVHPDDLERVLAYHYMRRQNPEEAPVHYDFRLIDSNNNIYNIIANVGLIPGTALSVVSGMDITQKFRVQQALFESEERYRSLIEHHPEPIFILGDGKFLYINPAGLTLFGEPDLSSIIRHELLQYVHKESLEDASQLTEADFVHDSEYCLVNEIKIMPRNGEVIDTEVTAVLTTFEGIAALQVIMRDISDQKRAETEIKCRNQRLSIINEIVEVANSSMILDEMMEFILKKVLVLMSFDMGWIYLKSQEGNFANLVVSGGIPDSFIDRWGQINARQWPYNIVFFGSQPRYVENLPDNPPGHFDTKVMESLDALSFAGIPLVAGSVVVGALYIGQSSEYSFSDNKKIILEYVGHEIGWIIQRAMLQNQLEGAFNEANLYLDILENDVKNALMSLASETGDIRKCVQKNIDIADSEYLSYADFYTCNMTLNINKISEIINNVSTIRRITTEPVDPSAVDLDAVIRGVIKQFPLVNIIYGGGAGPVYADNFVSEVFINLINNSVRFGGPDVRVWISVVDESRWVEVSVEDSGPGVHDEDKSAIFSCFRHGDDRNSRGLGLHITQIIIERYGGEVMVEDRIPGNYNEGLAIRFTLQKVDDGLYEDEDEDLE